MEGFCFVPGRPLIVGRGSSRRAVEKADRRREAYGLGRVHRQKYVKCCIARESPPGSKGVAKNEFRPGSETEGLSAEPGVFDSDPTVRIGKDDDRLDVEVEFSSSNGAVAYPEISSESVLESLGAKAPHLGDVESIAANTTQPAKETVKENGTHSVEEITQANGTHSPLETVEAIGSHANGTRIAAESRLAANPEVSEPVIELVERLTTTNTGPNTAPMDRREMGQTILDGMRSQRKQIIGSDEAMEMEVGWAKRGKSNAWMRTLEIWFFFAKILIAELKLRREKDEQKKAEVRKLNAKALRSGLLKLGPTFIKLGQLLSTRVDVLPMEYIDELIVLQDKVPGFDGKKAIEILETDLGASIDSLFDAFDESPIAAASLGQVHLAVFKGQQVAVKVQRQGLRELFDVDLKNLKVLAIILDKFDPKTDGANRDWVAIYEESAKLLYEEIDYEKEGRNADRFRKNFKNVKWVKVPLVYWERTSTRILTMEYCPGVKISETAELDRAGIDRSLLAERSGQSYLTQLFRHGFFHCDPHPGNISVDAKYKGRLIYYDFGMMAEIDPEVKNGLVNLIFGVYEGSEKDICDAMEQMGILAPNMDRLTVEKIGRYFLTSFRQNLMSERVTRKSKEEVKEELASRIAAIGEDLVTVGDDQPFRFPATFTFIFRAFTTLEGIGKGLSIKYDLTKIAQPYLKELIDLKDGSAVASAAKSLRKKLGWRQQDLAAVVQQPRKVDYMAAVLKSIETGDLKIRARVLDSERAFKRSELVQETLGYGILASTCLNSALVLTATAGRLIFATRILWVVALVSAIRLMAAILKLQKLDKRVNKFIGRQ